MKVSEALKRGSEMLLPVERVRFGVVNGNPSGCAMGMIDAGARFARRENIQPWLFSGDYAEAVWPWLLRRPGDIGVRDLVVVPSQCGSEACCAQIMRAWDSQSATIEKILAWIEEVESKLPYEDAERCVPGELELPVPPAQLTPVEIAIEKEIKHVYGPYFSFVGPAKSPEPTAADLAKLEHLIASAEEVCCT